MEQKTTCRTEISIETLETQTIRIRGAQAGVCPFCGSESTVVSSEKVMVDRSNQKVIGSTGKEHGNETNRS